MKIQPASDLHLEFFDRPASIPEEVLLRTEAEVIVLAGDIQVGVKAVHWAGELVQRHGKPVVYVPGNHEYYAADLEPTLEAMREAAGRYEGLHLLDRDEVVIGGARFLGATLWTDYRALGEGKRQACMQNAASCINDHRKIRFGPRRFLPEDAALDHDRSIAWLRQRLAEPFAGPTVVATHHAPTPKAQPAIYPVDLISAAFWSDLDPLIEASPIELWVYGHTHACLDVQVGKTRVVSNQRGYPRAGQEVQAYRPDWVLEVGEQAGMG